MKKRILLCVSLLILCMLFAACQKEPTCDHPKFSTATEKDATCVEKGILKHTCQLCGFTITQTTPVAAHTFTEAQTKEATCSEAGILTRTCDFCGTTEESNIAPVAHQFDFYSLTPSHCVVCGETVAEAVNTPDNPWYGKNWVALGTSLTSQEQGKFVTPLAERSGMNVTNLGIPGGTATAQILKAVQTADLSKADLITIEFGINDWFEGIPLGAVGQTTPYLAEIDDWSNEGTVDGTFAGACYQIFATLQKRAPQAVIIFLSESTGRNIENGDKCAADQPNRIELPQLAYTQTAMDVAKYMGIPTIDAGANSMINQYHPDYLADHVHHSELGGQQYALAVWMELKNIPPLLKAE